MLKRAVYLKPEGFTLSLSYFQIVLKTLLSVRPRGDFLSMRKLPQQEPDYLKTATFGFRLFSENPSSPPAPFALQVCLRTGAGAALAKGGMWWERNRALEQPRLFPGWDKGDGKVAYTASSSLSAHSVVLEPSRSTTVSRQSRFLPSGGCTSGQGKDGVGSSLSQGHAPENLPGVPNSPWHKSCWV